MLRHLVFPHVPCSSSGPAACAGYLGVFRSPGVRPSASLVTLVGLQPFPSFSVLLLLRLLAGVGWVMHPVAVVSAWVDGAVTLLPFSYLRVGVLLAYGVSGVCGLRWRSRLPFMVRHPFPVSVVLHLSGVGVAWSQVCGPSCDSWVLDSSDARLRRPDALASGRTLSFCRHGSLPWAFVRTWVSRPRPCLGSYLLLVVLPFPCPGFRLSTLAVGWSKHLLFSWALPWVLPSRFQCWLLA